MELSAADHKAFEGRSAHIDRESLARLYHLGTYSRDLPTGIERMIENAYDWEHLPFVHPSSFADIALVNQGGWGWRCKTGLPGGAGDQLVELLVDRENAYWATTVVGGLGEGTQIHTQATARDEGGITVDVMFYLPVEPETAEQGELILGVLKAQYAQLYDEDEALMLGRQHALDEKRALRSNIAAGSLDLGPEEHMDRSRVHDCQLGDEMVSVRHAAGRWIAHSTRCPHALGPLGEAQPGEDGFIACPWHGYRFSLADGKEEQARCRALRLFDIRTEGGRLVLGG